VGESLGRPGLRVGMKDAPRAQVRVLVEEIAALEAERSETYWISFPVKRSRPSQKAQSGFGQNSP
jgi:hypothetical protein